MMMSFLRDQSVLAKFVRFAVVGALSTLLYGLFTAVLISRGIASPVAASALGYLVVIPFNYILQRRFAFRSNRAFNHEIGRYITVHASNIAATMAVMHLVTGVFHADYRIGIVLTMTLVPVVVFLLLDKWVFPTSP